MLLLSGTLRIEEVNRDQFRWLLARYFSSRNWKVEGGESSLIARVGTSTDLLFRGYVFFCKQIEFDLSQLSLASYHFKPNWLFIGIATIVTCLIGALVIGSQYSGQEIAKVVVSAALIVPIYSLLMIGQLKSVILRDLKAIAHKA